MKKNKNLTKFKHQLEKEKKKIEEELKELERPPEFGTETYDEETYESQEFANQLSIAQILKNRLNAIAAALRKFVKRNYGICERCGKEIPAGLLKLVPESKLCKDCKKSDRE